MVFEFGLIVLAMVSMFFPQKKDDHDCNKRGKERSFEFLCFPERTALVLFHKRCAQHVMFQTTPHNSYIFGGCFAVEQNCWKKTRKPPRC